jgi:SHS2 domain-containing protein
VDATLPGANIEPTGDELSADAKALTLDRLDVKRIDDGWDATVVVDI